MKAAVCNEFGKPLTIETLLLDPPQTDEVRVKIAACAICHSDIHYAEGAWGGTLPAVYGHEAAGEVIETGDGSDAFAPGDAVVVTLLRSCGRCFYCAQGNPQLCETPFSSDEHGRLRKPDGTPVLQAMHTGAFAEEVVVHKSQLVKIGEPIPMSSAALLACGAITGYGAVVNSARVPPGSSVVVIGAGGVGLNSIQGAALCGANPVIAVDLLANKLTSARVFGATHALNPANQDVPGIVRGLTEGRGADYVFVTVGSEKAMSSAVDLLRNGGTAVLVGMPAVGAKMIVEAVNVAAAEQKIVGSKMGGTRLQVDLPRLMALYRQGRFKLDELVTQTYPLEEINDAIAAVKRGEALRNVIVFG